MLWSEFGQTNEQREILEVLSGDVAVGRATRGRGLLGPTRKAYLDATPLARGGRFR
jgi:hypothetical protein